MMDRRPTGATHSFRLSIRAAQIMETHPEIIPNSKTKSKSRWASTAIQWFFDSPLLQRERDPDTGDFTGKYVVAAQGAPHPIDLFIKIDELEQKLNEVARSSEVSDDEANHTSPGGGIRSILARMWPFSI